MSTTFPNLYVQMVFEYIRRHDGDYILYKDLIDKYKMSYPTIRKAVKWLVDNKVVTKRGRRFSLLPFIN